MIDMPIEGWRMLARGRSLTGCFLLVRSCPGQAGGLAPEILFATLQLLAFEALAQLFLCFVALGRPARTGGLRLAWASTRRASSRMPASAPKRLRSSVRRVGAPGRSWLVAVSLHATVLPRCCLRRQLAAFCIEPREMYSLPCQRSAGKTAHFIECQQRCRKALAADPRFCLYKLTSVSLPAARI